MPTKLRKQVYNAWFWLCVASSAVLIAIGTVSAIIALVKNIHVNSSTIVGDILGPLLLFPLWFIARKLTRNYAVIVPQSLVEHEAAEKKRRQWKVTTLVSVVAVLTGATVTIITAIIKG